MTSHRLSLEALIGPHSVPLGKHSHDCSYLTRRSATEEAWLVWQISPAAYHELMDRGFRRSGNILYRTACASCRKCVPIRVRVEEFKPSRSQRRALARNRDVRMIVHEPELTAEKHDVYKRYLRAQHDKSPQGEDMESMRDFLYSSCVASVEIEYRDAADKLLAVSICDVSRRSISSVYHFFDPDEGKRSLGVYSVLKEIELCIQKKIPYYYLGYWIEGCSTMDYKRQYQPHELLIEGEWVKSATE
ncbi:MAG: arginyltransferase [Planctomycetes bacterium]|nr:arginyltransferase [Planctomycetota bacterium]